MTQGYRWCAALPLVATLAGCGGDATMTIDLPPEERLPGLALEVEDQDGAREFARENLGTTDGGLTTGAFEVPDEGPIRISIRLESEVTTVAEGALEVEGREEFRWNVIFVFDTSDPIADCFGCLGSVSIPIVEEFRSEPDEALWGFWGGQREGSNVVY